MVLELIEGINLRDFVRQHGSSDVGETQRCIRELAEVLHCCHQHGLIHRDIKPANIVLRHSDLTNPVLVDFGLSFNDADEDDLTRVGEELGNRFLRLPEHTFGGRTATSDVTQLAGVFVYLLTGAEPRVLIDHEGLMPHQRAAVREQLARVFGGRQLVRLMSVLDRAFAVDLSVRYRTPLELAEALENAMRHDEAGDDDLESILARVDEITLSPEHTGFALRRQSLLGVLGTVRKTAQAFADARHLLLARSGAPSGDNAVGERIVVYRHGEQPGPPDAFSTFHVELRGPEVYVLLVDEVEVWRGQSPDDLFTDAVTKAVAKKFLDR